MSENILIQEKNNKANQYRNVALFSMLGMLGCFVGVRSTEADVLKFMFFILMITAIIAWILFFVLKNCEIVVTDKRVYGKVRNARVDLPLDSISSVGTTSMFHGVSVATSSGRITFYLLDKADEIYSVINDLLMERQGQNKDSSKEIPVGFVPETDETDKLKKYKELLDSGIITQEEFDVKKKQLLDI